MQDEKILAMAGRAGHARSAFVASLVDLKSSINQSRQAKRRGDGDVRACVSRSPTPIALALALHAPVNYTYPDPEARSIK